jgi:Ca2+-transporting ATPase
MAYIIAVHVPIAGLALLPLLTGMPLIFGPVHIAFLEMVIDPVCSMVSGPNRRKTTSCYAYRARRPVRSFPPALVTWSLPQGAIAFVPLAALYVLALKRGLPETDARSLMFVSLVLVDLGLLQRRRHLLAI